MTKKYFFLLINYFRNMITDILHLCLMFLDILHQPFKYDLNVHHYPIYVGRKDYTDLGIVKCE